MNTGTHATETADALVIGGGPAGSAAALRLARADFHVIQLERRRFFDPRNDRLRSGEGLIPRAVRELAALGVEARGAPWALDTVGRVKICWPDGAVTTNAVGRWGGLLQIDREAFDAALFEAARRVGADSREGWRALSLSRDERGRVCGAVAQTPAGEMRHIRARVVVDAGGRNALGLRQPGLRVPAPGGEFFAMAMFFDQVAGLEPGVWEMHLFDPERLTVVQLSRLAGGLVRCGLGTSQQVQRAASCAPRDFFWERVRHSPDLARRLARGQVVARPFARASIGYHVRQATFDGLLLAGDAAGYLNPLFGDGILRALVTAREAAAAAADALRRGDCSRAAFASYERQHAARARLDRLARGAILRMHRHPRALRLGRIGMVRGALLAALLR